MNTAPYKVVPTIDASKEVEARIGLYAALKQLAIALVAALAAAGFTAYGLS